ncbi:MAG TPA: electron transport complex subunit E, partial [Thiothrix sp.]|nr:electron transport complex subunit E [Thiothrix sp.]
MSDVPYKKIIQDGLWDNNPGLVQLLGLCPLMAVTTNTINGLGLAIATFITLVASNLSIALIRDYLRPEIRLPVFILIIAANVTIIDLLIHAFFFDLYNILGIFIPLIVTNCIIIGRAEAFASRQQPFSAWLDGVMMGIGFGAVLIVLGAMREIFAQGTLFDQAHLMFGAQAEQWKIVFSENYKGFLLAALPPGAFMGLGFLLAGKNYIDKKLTQSNRKKPLLSPLNTTAN